LSPFGSRRIGIEWVIVEPIGKTMTARLQGEG
jgi:hypothetical protein